MAETSLRAIISLHDVMPESLPRVKEVLTRLKQFGIPSITLLVVPGRDWQAEHIEWLHERVGEGYQLAAHGWIHKTKPKGIYHRLHSALISRDVAEHLALEKKEIIPFIQRSVNWFAENGFPAPALYVPPAWALGIPAHHGKIASPEATTAPFPRYIETLTGIIDTRSGQFHKLPLLGYEVDTAWRKAVVQGWNTRNMAKSRKTGLPVRIGLHPNDFSLLLGGDLKALLRSPNLTPVDLAASLLS